MKLDPTLIDDILRLQTAYLRQRGLGRIGTIAEPATRIIGRVIPEGVVKDGLSRADMLAGRTAPAWLRDHSVDDFHACAAVAARVRRQAVMGSGMSGVVSGLTGAAGLTVDMAVTFGVAARTIRLTAMAYGFGGDDAEDRILRAHALDLAMQSAGAARRDKANMIRHVIKRGTGAQTVPVAGAVVEDIAARAARLMLQRFGGTAAARIVPLASSAVGAAVNWRLQASVASAADYTYRQRWLATRQALPAPQDA